MYDVWENCSGVCRGCLSSDRKLSPLVHPKLYTTLLNKNEKDMDTSVVLFCWECAALLQRIRRFQLQTQKADQMLSESLETFLMKKSLSKLIVSHKQNYDSIIEETHATSDGLDYCDIEIKEEEENTTAKKEENYSDEAGKFDNDHFDLKVSSDEENAQNEENTIIETINEQSRKRKHVGETEFVAASMLVDAEEVLTRRSDRLKNIAGNKNTKKTKSNPKGLEKTKLKRAKGKNKQMKRKKVHSDLENKSKATPASITINKEIEIDISKLVWCPSDVEDVNAEKASRNEDDNEKSFTDTPDNTDTIAQDDKSETDSDSDSNKEDPDYSDPETREKAKKRRPERRYKKRGSNVVKRVFVNYQYDQLDEFFSEEKVADEKIGDVLKDEPKYTTEERPFGCEYCGWTFEIARVLHHHQDLRHRQIRRAMSIKDPTSPLYYRYSMYRCNICDKVLRREHAEAHMKYSHRVKFVCTECDAVFWVRSDADAHVKASHSIYSCELCRTVKKKKKYLDVHMETWHTPVTCEDCGEHFPMRKYLLTHREDKHPDSNAELRYCVQCNIQFRSRFSYLSHIRYTKTHRTDPPETFPCSECNVVLKSKYSLQCHCDRFHRGETRFQCPHCGKSYARRGGLSYHIATVHLKLPKPKDKICSYCGRGFCNNRILTHHIRTHTGERPHQCTFCPAAFAQPFPLKKHLATVHKHLLDAQNVNIVNTDSQALSKQDTNSLNIDTSNVL